MRRREFVQLTAGAAVAWPLAARAQQQAMPVVGVLMGADPIREAARLGAFRETLERLGWVDGRTVLIEVRYAEGRIDRYGSMAAELVALMPAVIACVGRPETAAVQALTRTIPIVFFQASDPVENGLVASLARPGGNTTGFSAIGAELDSKRLQLLHEIAPSLSRATFLINPINTGVRQRFADAEAAAKSLGIDLQPVEATTPSELTVAFAAVEASSSAALLVQSDAMLGTQVIRIIDFAAAHRLPTVFEYKPSVVRGGLLSYAADGIENARLAAGYVDKILRGAKPADLPVQQPTRFELVVNLKTAKALGLTVPQSILAGADEVIE
jgi:putative tryptophan/tyrosine transport system substrate-binding protein